MIEPDPEQYGQRAGTGGAVERYIHAAAAGNCDDAGERVFLAHVNHVIGAQFFRDLQARAVFGRAGDDDQRRSRLFADYGLRKSLLAGPLYEHSRVVADAAIEE